MSKTREDVMPGGAPQAFLEQRLAALDALAIIDTPAEPAYDDITRLAALVLKMPMALVSFVEAHRQWFKSEQGVGCRETPYSAAICGYALHSAGGLFEIEDLAADPRTAANPLVTGEMQARFYAGAVLRTSEGVPIGTVCVLDTVPRRLAAHEQQTLLALARQAMTLLELRRAVQQAEARERQLHHYMATVGHDLRQPLHVISASVELSAKKSDSEIVKKHLGHAAQAVDRLTHELERLAHAGSQGGALADVTLERFSLDDMLQNLARGWQAQAAAKGLRLDVALLPVEITSDRRLLASILGNLVGNAVKYTEHGSVTVAARLRGDKGVELSVTDTGIGLSKADRTVIFAPFTQLNAEREGLGLGLSLVKKAADYLGYRIQVASTVGVGSRFSFVIPLPA